MADYYVRFYHHVSNEPLVYKRKKRDTDETYDQNSSLMAHKAEKSALLLDMYENGDIPKVKLAEYGFDINFLRRYTYAVVFNNHKDKNFDVVTIAFCRQANGDQFNRKFGKDLALSRLMLHITEGRSKFKRGYGEFAFTTTVDELVENPGRIPSSIVYNIVRSRKKLESK